MNENKKPSWIKVKALSEESYNKITSISHKYNLYTICQEALCPNINECWSAKTATFLLMGEICTRNCLFCSVKTGNPKGYLDNNEPYNIAKAVKDLDLKYVVLTSVDRDDLEDGGSQHFAKTISEIKKINGKALVEVLIPDFKGNIEPLKNIIQAKPDVIGHNLETVKKLTPMVRDKRASYELSMRILKSIKDISNNILTKSSLQVGLGETELEIKQALRDLKEHKVDIVTIGQYLRPTEKQIPVQDYINPEIFEEYEIYAKNLDFLYVISGPLVRSSYKAAESFMLSMMKN
ncbi:MAG: lipoyl synthase [Candidatus Melainabacteria bacterium RIFOXYA12_FULL_32_12]|nr:MAG: lipoyl synthase [Candidatus Melainabacteria bacterium RIFOXYA2_FULL_32_9]OGI30438.1 MAG: lipoyl synthase [Candidatus Melainabacteria bacterium RIFOXYA12_FULL_32_12]